MTDMRCVDCGAKDKRTLQGALRCARCKSLQETNHIMQCKKEGCTRCEG